MMALSQISKLRGRMNFIVGANAALTNQDFNKKFTIDQTTEETHNSSYFIDGAVTDQAISLGKVNTPTFFLIRFESKFDGGGATTDNDSAPVTIKVDGGTAFKTNYFLVAVDDTTNDAVTSTVTFTTLADSDTIVEVLVLGRSS